MLTQALALLCTLTRCSTHSRTTAFSFVACLLFVCRARRGQPDAVAGGLKRSRISASVVQQQTNWLKTFREELRHSATKSDAADYGRPSTAHAAIYSDHVGGAGAGVGVGVGVGGNMEDERKTQPTGTRV